MFQIKYEFPDYKHNGFNEEETIKYHLFHDTESLAKTLGNLNQPDLFLWCDYPMKHLIVLAHLLHQIYLCHSNASSVLN